MILMAHVCIFQYKSEGAASFICLENAVSSLSFMLLHLMTTACKVNRMKLV